MGDGMLDLFLGGEVVVADDHAVRWAKAAAHVSLAVLYPDEIFAHRAACLHSRTM